MPALPTAPNTPRRLRALWAVSAFVAACLPGCQPESLPPPDANERLVVAVRISPTSWYPGPDGQPTGFDHDLLARFAEEHKLKLEAVEVGSAGSLLARVAAGEVHMGAGGLYRPPAGIAPAASADDGSRVLWTSGFFAVEPVLIYTTDGFKPKDWKDLAGATVAYVEGTGVETSLAKVRREHPEVQWQPLPLPSADALIAQVSDGAVDYAVVPSVDAAAARNVFLDYDVGFAAGAKRDLAWAVAPLQGRLRDDLDEFLAKARRDGLLKRLAERYFSNTRQVERIDAGVFLERIRTLLPEYRSTFQRAQVATGVDWRLLAAIAYQESQWDPFATSETGVRGLMQITEDTARHLKVDRLNPLDAVVGAALYVQDLKSKLPPRIGEPDRTWFALAAYNIGLAHLEDARILAQKQKLNPDVWSDVKQVLPLLALPEYHEGTRYGYARGGMPVSFVERVRAYYDILLRQEPVYQPRLRAFPFAAAQ